MTANEISERKKYRSAFIIHALLGVAGIAVGLYVYKFTDWLAGAADGYVYACRADARELFERFYVEARWVVALFLCGFTIFAQPAAIIFSTVRGFVCAVGVLRLARCCLSDGIGTLHFVLTVCFMSLVFAVELIMAAKSVCFSAQMHYTAPKVNELVRDARAKRYAATFGMVCAMLFAAVTAVYFAPLLPF